MGWYAPVIPVQYGRRRQEEPKFKTSLGSRLGF